ncbi:MAG TPA: discoidin domain-containing protein [Verrucomicrobiae bacterium]
MNQPLARLPHVLCICLAMSCAHSARGVTVDNTVSLAGRWRFEIAGTNAQGFNRELPGRIRLPGTIDDAGLGPRNTNAPTLAGPYRLYDYAGPAWYQRDIEIPSAWRGQRVTLFLERVRWTTRVWLDDKFIGTQDSLIAPHLYDFGTGVAPGKHRLTICVDNTVKINLGGFVSALFGGTWGNMNGIVGRIELGATPPVWLDEVQVYPRLASRTVAVKGRVGNAAGNPGHGVLQLELRQPRGPRTTAPREIEVSWDAADGTFTAELPIGDAGPLREWDEFAPDLYELRASLNRGAHVKSVAFGFREFSSRGTQFTLNGRPVYLRGTLECSVFPLTGYPPTDPAEWRRIFRTIKAYGLNFMRFHSWCPPEAAFEAADIEGVMLHVEGPQANVQAGVDPVRDAFIEAEFWRIVDSYGNHPSFCLMTLGNEYGGKDVLLSGWLDMLMKRDPRHLYSSASAAQTTANRQWTESADGRGIQGPGTQRDLRQVVASDSRPIVGHEIAQWMFFPDFEEMKKYTGVMAPKNFEMIRDDLQKKNLLELAPEFVKASGQFAVRLYKEEIEVLLRTPGYAGFSLLDLHDYPNQGTALIGPLDPFWDSKGFITPEAFRRFCGPTVPLLRMPKRTLTTDEPFEAAAELAHYGAASLVGVRPVWTIKDKQGRRIAAGQLTATNAPTGGLTALGAIHASLANAAAPAKLNVTVALEGTPFSNDWDIWVYPPGPALKPPTDFVVCDTWDAARTALASGKKVIFFAAATNTSESMRGRFLPVFWSPVWFPRQKPNTMGLLCDPAHPLFTQFTTDFHSDWQWYELMQRSRLFVLDETPPEYRPCLQVIDNFARNHKLGIVFEGRVGPGQLLVCGFDLPAQPKDPAARQFLASLYAYAGSPAFKPARELGDDLLEKLFVPKFSNKLQELGAKIRADSAADDYSAENAIDGDPDTMWHTPWGESATPFPHTLIIEFPKATRITGLTCLPRQDNNHNGWIKDYTVQASADGQTWASPVAQGSFTRNDQPKTIKFAAPVDVKFLKLTALSSFNPADPFASLAELSVTTE